MSWCEREAEDVKGKTHCKVEAWRRKTSPCQICTRINFSDAREARFASGTRFPKVVAGQAKLFWGVCFGPGLRDYRNLYTPVVSQTE